MLSLSPLLLVPLASAAFAADDPPPPPTVAAAVGKGVTVSSADGRYALNVKGRVQLREVVAVAAPDDDGVRDVTLSTLLYTARLVLSGDAFGPHVKYQLQLALAPRDYRDGAISPVYDAYLDLDHDPNLSVRLGQSLVPFDRLRTIREFALELPDRSRVVSELSLDRDLGVYAYSDHLGGASSPFAYRVGVFSGSGIGQLTAKQPGGLVVGRVELRPLGEIDDDSEGDLTRREAPALAVGLAAAYNFETTRARSTTSTVYTGGTVDYVHLAGDAVFKVRGFAFEAEVLYRDSPDDTLTSTDDDGNPVVEYTRSGWGLVTQPSLMLSDRVQLAGRYARLAAADGTDPAYVSDAEARANEVAAGASLYLNAHRFKAQAGVGALFGDEAPADAELTATALVDVTF